VADAGPDQTVLGTSPGGASVTLDGSASFDPDGDALTFTWEGPFGTASGVSPVVTLPIGTSSVALTVSDGLATATDWVAITVLDPARTLASLGVDPADPTIEVGQAQAFTATGTFRDGSTQALTGGGLPPPPGVVGWWPGDGDGNDIVGGHPGTLVNGAAFAPGMAGQAFSLDGVDGRVDIPIGGSIDFSAGITTDAWVRPTSIKPGSRVASRDISSTSCSDPKVAFSLEVRADAGNRAVFSFSTPDDVLHQVTGTSVIPTGAFTHLAATYDGSAARLFVNGVLENSLAVSGSLKATLEPMVVGNAGEACRSAYAGLVEFDGLVDEVELYARALDASDIQAIFGAGSAERCQSPFGCVAWSSSTAAAAIDAGGLATGQSPGTTTIAATSTADPAIAGSTTLTVVTPNEAPTANAGPDRTVDATSPAGAAVTLDGSASFDPEGTALRFTWTGPFGVATGATPTVTLPLGTSTVTLTVDDGRATDTDTVAITVVRVAPPDVIIDETTPQSVLDGLVNPLGCILLVGTTRTTLVMPNLVSIGNCLSVTDNANLSDVDLVVGGGIGGDLTITDNDAAADVDLVVGGGIGGDLTITANDAAANVDIDLVGGVGGSVTVSDNTAAADVDIDVVGGVGSSVTITDNSAASSIDVGASTIGGDVVVTGNDGATSIDVGASTIGGDVVVTGNGSSTVTIGSLTTVGGDLNVSSTGPPVFDGLSNTIVVGEVAISTRNATRVSGQTGGGTTSVTLVNGSATMNALLPRDTFAEHVPFTIESLGNAGSLTGPIVDGSSNTVTVTEIAAYHFTFAIATLNQDATLTFDIDVAGLDEAGRLALLAAVASNRATLGVQGDAPGSIAQVFDVCEAGEVPTSEGCVQVVRLDATGGVIPDGDPGVPATVRFVGVTGHFSTFALVLVSPIDTTPPVISGVPADIVAEATSAAGAVVTYATPTAIDDRDGVVPVTCVPASGDTFPLGTTTVTCGATDAAGNSSTRTFTVTVTPLTPGADLSVTNTASPNPVTLGSPLTYTLTIGNNGPSPATDVWIVHASLGNVRFVSATASQGRCVGLGSVVACNLGTLPNGTAATVTIVVIPKAKGNLPSTAYVWSPAADPNPANNQASTTTRVR
jgi:hypothetical protein